MRGGQLISHPLHTVALGQRHGAWEFGVWRGQKSRKKLSFNLIVKLIFIFEFEHEVDTQVEIQEKFKMTYKVIFKYMFKSVYVVLMNCVPLHDSCHKCCLVRPVLFLRVDRASIAISARVGSGRPIAAACPQR